MNKPNVLQDSARLRALKRLSLLDTPPEEVFDRITRLISKLVNVPVALISIVDKDRQFFKSQIGVAEPWASRRETPLSHSFCQYVVMSGNRLVVVDAREDPLLRNNLAIPELDVIAYAGMPIASSEGQILGSVCMIDSKPRDWTDDELAILEDLAGTVKIEIELREKLAELAEQNADLDAFAHTVAHDLRNPISVVSGFSELLQDNFSALPESTVSEYLTSIHASAEKMNSIVKALMSLAQVRQAQIEKKPLQMETIVVEVQKRLAPMINEYQAELVIPESWPVALGYAPWVEEVLVNYITNALKYGGRPPRVALTATVQSDGSIRFGVSDNGKGLTAEEQSKLFTPFTRLNQVKIEGHGLGLSIVRRIVEKLDGEVGIQSEPGCGSVFTFTLPGFSPNELDSLTD